MPPPLRSHLWEFQQKSCWTDLAGAGEVPQRSVTKCDILTTNRLAVLKLRICKVLLMTLSLKYAYVDHILCWLKEICSCGLICMQMSHANFKITKKDLELISRIKERVRQPWPRGFPGNRIILLTKHICCQRSGCNFSWPLTEPLFALEDILYGDSLFCWCGTQLH
jgi:hypothetical protein